MRLVSKEDLDISHIRGSGPGGQHRNKTSTGVRIVHRASGAIGEATDSKSQEENKRAAFRRMAETPEFKVWMDLQLHPELLRIETRRAGEWVITK
jgi:protein subunit release factor B